MIPARKIQIHIRRLIFGVMLLCVVCPVAFAQPWEGNGVEGDPYLIYDACDMQAIGADSNYWDAHFKLCADIDLGSLTGTSFNIIGTSWNNAFTGVFDGNGHTISRFTYSATGTGYVGLFGVVNSPSAEIRDVGLIEPSVYGGTGSIAVGALVGTMDPGSVSNCYVEGGSVTGTAIAGGLVGMIGGQAAVTKPVTQSYATCRVSGNSTAGGLVGVAGGLALISSCYSRGQVSGQTYVGGLAGRSQWGTITNCYATGSVSGDSKVGGLAGYSYGSDAHNSFAAGIVDGNTDTGGFLGYAYESELVPNSYAGCFWNIHVNPGLDGIGNANDPNVTALSTGQMQEPNAFLDAGWDFVDEVINGPDDIWDMCQGTNYPKLVWAIPDGDFLCPDGVTFTDYSFFAGHWLETDYGDVNGVELSGDGKVNWEDFGLFAEWWMVSGCGGCGGADFTGEGDVDYLDLDVFAGYWLESEYGDCGGAELTGDGAVGLDDLGRFSVSWLAGL